MDKIFESSLALISVNTQSSFFVLELKGVIDYDEYNLVFTILLEEAIRLKYRKLFINLKKLESSSAKSRAWLISNFSIKIFDNIPDVKVAVVKSNSYFQELVFKVIQTTLLKNYKGLSMELFLDSDSACNWLISE